MHICWLNDKCFVGTFCLGIKWNFDREYPNSIRRENKLQMKLVKMDDVLHSIVLIIKLLKNVGEDK